MELRHTIAARLHLLHRLSCPWSSDAPPSRAWLGEYGELVAASYLRAKGLKVLYRNFRYGDSGEIDIVCRDNKTLVACEVKSSGSPQSGAPMRAVNHAKRDLLRKGMRNWLHLLKRDDIPTRFDIIEVYLLPGQKPDIRHHAGAFGMHEGNHL
ncbi:MAG: YraN family protein [Akkermansia sp.]|jgi:putative endonuclease|nr:YraN family protein [Akkermansia sp.]